MAGADTSKVRLMLEEIVVPENLVEGNKFLKWDEDSSAAIPVTLKVDPHGYFLYWKFQNKDVECLELTQLRDTRTGKYAMTPKDAKLRDLCDMGSKDEALEDKTITLVYGSDIVNLTFLNFCATSSKIAQEWTEVLLKIAHNRTAQNPSQATLLRKIYTKITIMVNRDGHIPVKNIRKMFSSSSSDRKKVETALQVAGVHSGKDDTIDPKKFSYDVFFTFFLRLVNQKEVDKLFQEMGAKNKPYLTTDQLVKFLNNQQRDPRLNEILYPFYDAKQAMGIIERFEKNKQFAKRGNMSIEGLIRYLLSDDNQVDGMESYLIAQDMEQPLAHYFIKSSHNTYLTGHQLTGRSSVEIYRQVMLSGCRCVELDCWDGKGDTDPEPIITHGYTMCTDVLFKDVIEAINEAAFKTSDYPVILSFENHCNQKQQAKMAHYCRTIFGDKLLIDPMSEFPLESGKPLPWPSAMKFKILVKNKKRKQTDANKKRAGRRLQSTASTTSMDAGDVSIENKPSRGGSRRESKRKKLIQIAEVTYEETLNPDENDTGKGVKTIEETAETPEQNGEVKEGSFPPTPEVKSKLSRVEEKTVDAEVNGENGDATNDSKIGDGLEDVDEESLDSDDEEALSKEEALKKMQEMKDSGTAGKEAEAGAEMSALVNYIQPVHFSSFETSNKKNHSHEISSFVETSAMNRVKENPVEFVNYNKRQLSRIYPKGTRVDSSNFMPQIFWNVGCQLVALNYQNLDLAMQFNLGIFNLNGRTGYILKPDFMRRKDRHFDPFAESTMDGIVAATVEVKVLSGQFLSDKKVGTYVEVDMFGLPADTVRKKYKTKTVSNTGINPQFDDDGFVFPKVIMPKLASLRITAYDDNNKQIGHRILPVDSLRPGYRFIPLRNELYTPLLMPSLLVHIKVSDYVPKGLANFADALVNPIQHQMKLDEQIKMRTEALSKLMEEATKMEESYREAGAMGAAGGDDEDAPDGDVSPGTSKGESQSPGQPPAPSSESKPDKPRLTEDRKLSNKPLDDAARLELEKRDSVPALPPGVTKIPRTSRQSETQLQILLSQMEPQEEIIAATIEEIKQEKKYQKVNSRLDAELGKLVKKQEKKQSKLKKSQAKDLNKLKSSQEKAKKNREKKNAAMEKKMSKGKHANPEEAKRLSVQYRETLEQEQEKEMLKKQVSHEDALIDLYRRHYLEEKELKVEHAEMLFELQMDLMAAVHEKQLKKLDAQHKKVEQDLRKMLGSKNIEEMKSITKMKREKQEVSRLKREARKKHIDQAVTETSHLLKIQENKKAELKEKMKELQQNLSQEEDDMLYVIDDEYKLKCDQLIKDRKFKRLISDSNGSVAANPDAITPDVAGSSSMRNGLNGEMKMSAGSGLNGISDGPSSDPEVPESNGLIREANAEPGVSNSSVGSPVHVAKTNGGSNGISNSDGQVAAEVEVHATANSFPEEENNTNNSAQTQSNTEITNVNFEIANGHAEGGEGEEECKDSETGERSKIRDSPQKATPVVESTRL